MTDQSDKVSWSTVLLNGTGKILESLQMENTMGQSRFRLISTRLLSNSTRAGIIDMTPGKIKRGKQFGKFIF